MRDLEVPITFEPHGKRIQVPVGTSLLEAAATAGIILQTPCGGRGTCGKCRVQITGSSPEANSAEQSHLTTTECAQGFRLACQHSVDHTLTITIPKASQEDTFFQIAGSTNTGPNDIAHVAIRKQYVELSPPTREDSTPDIDRIQTITGPFGLDLDLLRLLPSRLRQWQFRGTAVLADHRLIDFEEGDTETTCFAIAVDIGTTTLAAVLIDLTTGYEKSCASRINLQTRFGGDVLSRILYTRSHTEGAQILQQTVIKEINAMIEEMCRETAIPQEYVYEIIIAGNTTMQQLVTAVDSTALGEVPFTPATSHSLLLNARDLGIHIHPRGRTYLFPVIGGFVGGDTVAGMVATKITDIDQTTVLVDIGTNGEIVLCHTGKTFATSTAAGPAFEGARIRHGMRATAGAIEKIAFGEEFHISVIGDTAPVGLCGSALIDVAAELLRCGALMQEGVLLTPDQLDTDTQISSSIRSRLISTDEGPAFVLASAEESGTGTPILLTQADIRELQLATAAIRAGFAILLQRANVKIEEIDQVLIAGGFGNYIRTANAQRIGLLPPGIRPDIIRSIGNSTIMGARLAATSQQVRDKAETLARTTHHIDLSLDPAFQREYVEGMFFPK